MTDTQATMAASWALGHGETTLPTTWQDLPWRSVTPEGRVVTNRLPGAIVWGGLFYFVLPTSTAADRVHDLPVWPGALAAAAVAALAMAALFLALDRLLDDRRLALGAALLFGLGTPTWSVSSDALWTHGPAQLGVALALLAMAHERWGLAGLALGWAMFSRPHVGPGVVVLGLGLAWSLRAWRPVLGIGVGAVPGFLGLVAWSRIWFDRWQPFGGYETQSIGRAVTGLTGTSGAAGGGFTLPLFLRQAPDFLFHPLRGVLLYTPLLWICLPGLRRGWRAAPAWVRWSAIAGLVSWAIPLAVNVWHGGDDHFGYRTALEGLTFMAPLLVLSWRASLGTSTSGRRLSAVVAAASVVLYALGSTAFDPRASQREEHLRTVVQELGPNGEGYNPGTAVGPDLSGD